MAVMPSTMAGVKMALGLTVSAYDPEVESLVSAAKADLELALGRSVDESDPLVLQAIKTYARLHFGSPADFDRLQRSYDAQKGQLQIATGYTEWGDHR